MAGGQISNDNKNTSLAGQGSSSNNIAISFMVALFFVIGFITVLNDVLIPSLKSIFDFGDNENWKLALIQLSFFIGYFIMAIPAGILVTKVGYKKGLFVAIGVTVTGLLLFWPAAAIMQYWFYLMALFIVAGGFAILQVIINPYLSALGSPEKSASRMNLGGGMNSLATFVGPMIGAYYMLKAGIQDPTDKAELLRMPYVGVSILLLVIAGLLYFTKLPKLKIDSKEGDNVLDFAPVLKYRHLNLGALAIFFYVGAEVAIGSWVALYTANKGLISFDASYIEGMSPDKIKDVTMTIASGLIPLYWGGAMIGRFAGSLITQRVKGENALTAVALVAVALVTFSAFGPFLDSTITLPVFVIEYLGEDVSPIIDITIPIGIFLLVLVGLFNSIMWPSIFPLGIKGLGSHTGKGSGIMVTMVLGGAVMQFIVALLADAFDSGFRFAFLSLVICYGYILFYAFYGHKWGLVKKVYDGEIEDLTELEDENGKLKPEYKS